MRTIQTLALLVLAAGTFLVPPQRTVAEEPVLQFVVNTVADTVDANPGDGICADADGNCSLRAAIQEANAASGCVQIVVNSDPDLDPEPGYVLTRTGSAGDDSGEEGDLDITGHVIIRSSRSSRRRPLIHGDFSLRLFDVHEGGHLELLGVTLVGGFVEDESGAGIRNRGRVTLHDVKLFGMRALPGDGEVATSGGGIFNDGGVLHVRNSLFRNCEAVIGGAIAASGGETTLVNCRVAANRAREGGAVHAAGDANVTVSRCYFESNNALRGGVLFNRSGTVSVTRSTLVENHAKGHEQGDGGGGVFNAGGTTTITRSRIWDNDANGDRGAGGGVFVLAGRVVLDRCSVRANIASHSGGGVAAVGGDILIDRSRFLDNIALFFDIGRPGKPGDGGAVHLSGPAGATIDGCVFVRNEAYADGAGLSNASTREVRVVRSRFTRNRANRYAVDKFPDVEPLNPIGRGGAVYHEGTALEIDRCRLRRNRAVGDAASGGAIFNAGSGLDVTLTVIAGNSARSSGGGLELEAGSDAALDRVSILSSSSRGQPGLGGGVNLRGAATLTMNGGRLSGNRAAGEGGGLRNSDAGTATLVGTRITGNRAPSGRDVFSAGGAATVNGRSINE